MAKSYASQWLAALARTHPQASQFVGSPKPDPQEVTPDAAYTAQLGANKRPYETGLAQLPKNLESAGANYGYTYNVDPNDPTKVTVGGVDASNPYSRAALLQRSYESQQRGNTTGYASRGQLYAGSLQNAQDESQRGFNQASTENRRSFEDVIRGFVNNIGQLDAQRGIDDTSAYGDLVQRRASDPNQPPSSYAGVPYLAPTADDPFATPLAAPTAASVMASKSLRGTAYDRPIIGPYKRPKKRKP